ncbi:MAG: hypothetical protein JSV26_02925 [bacterium]|nr:MAG: hypothetical protein JSV26_02925 [bacterium]
MSRDNLSFMKDLLQALRVNEEAMGRFYLACSEAWPDESSLWMQLALEEEQHENIIDQLLTIVEANPDRFSLGRPFEISAIQTYTLAIGEMTGDIRKGSLSLREALSFAKDMEESFIESRYFEAVRSDSRKFLDLAGKIAFDTDRHRKRLIQRIERQSG